MPSSPAPSPTVVQRRYTIPITCCLEGRAHDVTDENFAAGQSSGKYLAECGYRVLAALIGRPCPECAAVVAVARQTAPHGRIRSAERMSGRSKRGDSTRWVGRLGAYGSARDVVA